MSPPTYLKRRKGVFYVQVPVPRAAQSAVGAKTLERSLRTTDERIALSARHAVVAEFLKRIAEAGNAPRGADALVALAQQLRDRLDKGKACDGEVADFDATFGAFVDAHRKTPTSEPSLLPEDTGKVRRAAAIVSGRDALMLDKQAEQWIELEATKGIKHATLKEKQTHLSKLVKHLGPDAMPDALTKPAARKFVEDVLNPWKISKSRKQLVLQSCSQFAAWLEVHDRIAANPFAKVGQLIRAKVTDDFERDRGFTAEEAGRLLAAMPSVHDPMWSLLALLAYTGARPQELCGVRVSDVGPETFHIPKSKTTAGKRDVPLHPVVAPLVARLAETSSDGFLIPGLREFGKDRNRYKFLGNRLQRLVSKTVPEMDAYSFRRTVNSQMTEAGVPEWLREQIIGHKAKSVIGKHYTDAASLKMSAEALAHVTYGATVDTLVREVGATVRITRVSKARKS